MNGINFENNSGTNLLTNSGTIQSDTSGNYGGGIVINEASVSEIINTSTGTIRVIDSSVNSAPIRVNTGGVVNKIENDENCKGWESWRSGREMRILMFDGWNVHGFVGANSLISRYWLKY